MQELGPQDWGPAALEARARIAEAFHRYATGHDEARADVVLSCFTDDIVFEAGQAGTDWSARCEAKTEVGADLTRNLEAMTDQRRHLIGNILVDDLDLERGTASALAISVVTSAEIGLTLKASVLYDTRLRREVDGCWRFSYFHIGMDHFAGELPPPPASNQG